MEQTRIFTDRPTNWVENTWRENAPLIYKLCRARSSNKEAADDLFQEVALKFCKAAPDLSRDTPLCSWFRSVVMHTYYDLYRKNEHILSLSRLRDYQQTYEAFPEQASVHYQECKYVKVKREALKHFMSTLDPVERMVTELSYLGEIPLPMLSRTLNLSKSSLCKIRNSALRKMKRCKVKSEQRLQKKDAPSFLLKDLLTGGFEIS